MAKTALTYNIEGAGPKIVLLHPVGLDMTCWDRVASHLSAKYTVLRLDTRGHGNSPSVPAGWSLEDYADDIHNFLASLGFGPAAMIGLSFGGMIAQTIAIRHPRDISALIACGCPSTLPEVARNAMQQRALDAEQGGMATAIEETLLRWFTPGFIASGGAEPTRLRLLSDDVSGWSTAWRAISQLDTQPKLHLISAPSLCIAGALDPAAQPAVMEQIAQKIPNAQFRVIPGAPHMMQLEQPEAMASLITEFLSGIEKI